MLMSLVVLDRLLARYKEKTVPLVVAVALLMMGMPPSLADAFPEIEVNGLFNKRAVLTINGKQQFLKQGKSSPEGVMLVSASPDQAVVEFSGQRLTLHLSTNIASTYTESKKKEARIQRDQRGHYLTTLLINGRTVRAMFDTGATSVAMNQQHATMLGIDYANGIPGKASTAGGVVDTRRVTLQSVEIGTLAFSFIEASVVLGDSPRIILLGNSLLSKVNMREEKGVLVLTGH